MKITKDLLEKMQKDELDKAQLAAYKALKTSKKPFAAIYAYDYGGKKTILPKPLLKNNQEEVQAFIDSFSKGNESVKATVDVFYQTQLDGVEDSLRERGLLNNAPSNPDTIKVTDLKPKDLKYVLKDCVEGMVEELEYKKHTIKLIKGTDNSRTRAGKPTHRGYFIIDDGNIGYDSVEDAKAYIDSLEEAVEKDDEFYIEAGILETDEREEAKELLGEQKMNKFKLREKQESNKSKSTDIFNLNNTKFEIEDIYGGYEGINGPTAAMIVLKVNGLDGKEHHIECLGRAVKLEKSDETINPTNPSTISNIKPDNEFDWRVNPSTGPKCVVTYRLYPVTELIDGKAEEFTEYKASRLYHSSFEGIEPSRYLSKEDNRFLLHPEDGDDTIIIDGYRILPFNNAGTFKDGEHISLIGYGPYVDVVTFKISNMPKPFIDMLKKYIIDNPGKQWIGRQDISAEDQQKIEKFINDQINKRTGKPYVFHENYIKKSKFTDNKYESLKPMTITEALKYLKKN